MKFSRYFTYFLLFFTYTFSTKSFAFNLEKVSDGQHTDVIQLGNNFIILKIEEIKETNVSFDKNKELEKMIKFETNKQLNQFSRIFFDKSKINYRIDEK